MGELESIRTDLRQDMERAGIAVLGRRDIVEERVIAKGGYAKINKGTRKSDGSRVVIKRMLASKYDVDQVKLFAKETKLLSVIKHPNIVSLLAVCIEPTSFSPVMEFMEFNLEQLDIHDLLKGSTLAELLDVLERANLVDEIGVRRGVLHKAALDVVTGLAFLHHRDICHRDMKPANILVTNTGDLFTFKLTDFGEGRATNLQTESEPHEYTNRVHRGTRRFFSPEQIMGSLVVADIAALKRIDVWSCGMIIFCMLSPDIMLPWDMDLPSQGNQDEVLEARIADRQLPRGSNRYKHLADKTGLGVIYHRCCHFDHASRPDIAVIQYELSNLTYSRRNIGRSLSPDVDEHGDSGVRARDVPENLREPPIDAKRTLEAADNPRAMEVRAKAKQVPKAADQPWMHQIEALRDELVNSGAKILGRSDVKEGRQIARGSSGRVILGTLKEDKSRVVIKKMLKWNVAQVKLCCKEIKLLSETSHPNIVRLRGVCLQPLSPILEYLEFNLDEMNIPETEGCREGSTLAELLIILEEADLVEEVGVKRGVLHKAAVDVAMGLAFLHHNNICHRDLKPANVLVKNSRDFFIFKLADFGDARANHLQTASVVYTERVQRGTKVFFAPEQLLQTLAPADTLALKRVDIWCYGMIVFCLLSPDLVYPWEQELMGQTNLDNMLKAVTANILPRGSDKYKDLPEHTGLGSVYQLCCHYDPAQRPGVDTLQELLTNLTFSRINIGRSLTPAVDEHGDRGGRARDVPENPREPPIDAERTPEAADNPRAMDVRAKAKQVPKAADQPWDAAAYGGLRVTGVVGEEAGPGRLQCPHGVSAYGDWVWVVDWDSDRVRGRVVVFRRTTEGGHTAHRYVAESAVPSPLCITATDREFWISQGNGQLQGVRLEDGEVVLTRTLPTTGRLADPWGLAYRGSSQSLYVCCRDGVHVVNVAGGVVVATLNAPPEVKGAGRRPMFVSVLQDTILVAYCSSLLIVYIPSLLVLYTGDGAPGRVLHIPGLSAFRDITHNGEHFVVGDREGHSLPVVSREGEEVIRMELQGDAVTRVGLGEVAPWCISCPPHHHLLYVTDYNKKLFVVSR